MVHFYYSILCHISELHFDFEPGGLIWRVDLDLDQSTVLGVDGIILLSWLGGLEYMLHMVLIILNLPNVTGNITFIFCFIASSVRLESCHALSSLLLVASSWYVREGPGTGARLKVCKVLISNSAFSE